MKQDTLLAGLLFVGIAIYLVQRHVAHMLVWVLLTYLFATEIGELSQTVAVISGLVVVFLISAITKTVWEGFEDGKKEGASTDGSKPEPAPPKTNDPHVDIGTTILHAYRNLSPEQIGGMRRDTKELMELQKELMGSLSEMKPAIEQGAELLKTFSTFFGKNE
jgi:hypothetical protein